MASTHRRAVGIFSSRPQTASALQALSDSGFSMGDVSIIAKDADHQKDIAGITVKDEVTNRAETGGAIGATTGGVLGGVTGLLVGLGTLTIPGLGPALLAGEAAVVLSTLVGGAAGAAAGGLVGALVGLGIPKHRAERYRDRVAQGDYLVMLKGSENDIAQAERTLSDAGIEDWGVYPVADEPHQANGHRVANTSNSGVAIGDRRDPNWRDRPLDNTESYRTSEPPHSSHPIDARALGGTAVSDPPRAQVRAEERRVVGVFLNRDRMETALAQLQQTGFPMHTLSMAVREAEAPDQRQDSSSHSLAGATRLTAGLERMLLPEVGNVLVMGPDAQALANTLRSSANSLEANGSEGRATGLGIAPESAHLYQRHLTSGAYLITLRGHNQDLLQAAATLGEGGMHDWGIYDVSYEEAHR